MAIKQKRKNLRKTDLVETTDKWLIAANPDLENAVITDATKKGLENLLGCERKGVLSSSELANTMYCEGISDSNAGLHFVSKARMCQYTQSEKIATATGAGRAPLGTNTYSFVAKLVGQYEPLISVMAPNSSGWFKRPVIAVVPPHFLPDPSKEFLDCQASDKLIQASLRNSLHKGLLTVGSCVG